MIALDCELPRWANLLFQQRRYKIAKGGRGGAKSWTIARVLLILGASRTIRVLCARELQRSIQDSVHALLVDQIQQLGLQGYTILKHEITHINGTRFMFEGLRYNTTKIKSLEGIDVCWVEEAESISEASWNILIPTIRKEGSEIWISFNPQTAEDPVYQRFVTNRPENSSLIEVNWQDNPWFHLTTMPEEKDYLYRVDPEMAEHVWGGQTIKATAAAVLRGKWVVEAFDPTPNVDTTWMGPYHGADFGFGDDPTTCVRVWIRKRKLFIERESYKLKLENDEINAQWQKDIPGVQKYIIRADNSRPETISYLKRHGLSRISSVLKWPGSVEDGIAYLRNFEQIVIHPRCIHAKEEARLYSHKVDRLTGEVQREIVDKHNHIWDPVRYALAPIIRAAKAPRSGYSGQSYQSN